MSRVARRPRIRVAISSCLLGEPVRYDGGHKLDPYITQTLGRYFEFVPFCPEVAIGLGVPRPPVRLIGTKTGVAVRGVEDASLDVTERLAANARRVARKLTGVSGYILKRGSPSCGMMDVPIHDASGKIIARGSGLYASTLRALAPTLPFEEEGRLMDPALRENFLERVVVYHRWQKIGRRLTPAALIDFHARHKLVVLAHDEKRYRALGRLVAQAGDVDIREMGGRYIEQLMAALARPATRARHANVLQHILGHFKRLLDAADKQELLEAIDGYKRGELPWSVPVTLLRHHLRRFPNTYLATQHYLAPPAVLL